MKRKDAREQAFILAFENIFNSETEMQGIITLFDEAASAGGEDSVAMTAADDFAKLLALGVEKKQPELDELIEKYAIGWRLSRLSKVSLAVLRLAFYEILYVEEVPVSVTINEAVEIAKKYSTQKDAAFINGLLGTYVRANEKTE